MHNDETLHINRYAIDSNNYRIEGMFLYGVDFICELQTMTDHIILQVL